MTLVIETLQQENFESPGAPANHDTTRWREKCSNLIISNLIQFDGLIKDISFVYFSCSLLVEMRIPSQRVTINYVL